MEEHSIAELQGLMQAGELSAVELTQAYLDRIERIDRHGPSLNAVIELNPDALEIAARRISACNPVGRGPRWIPHLTMGLRLPREIVPGYIRALDEIASARIKELTAARAALWRPRVGQLTILAGEGFGSREVRLTGRLICASPSEAEIVERHLPRHVELTRAEPGCLHFEVLPTAGGLVWNVHERFADEVAFGAHRRRVAGSEWGQVTAGIERSYTVEKSSGF